MVVTPIANKVRKEFIEKKCYCELPFHDKDCECKCHISLFIAIIDSYIDVLKDLKKEKERELKELNEVMKK
jgi:hypothetical protein